MKTKWTKETLSRVPLEFERANPTTWIQRRDIQKAPPNEDGSDGGYTCLCLFISNEMKRQIEVTQEALEKPQATIDRACANIDYLSMMTGVDLPDSD